MRLELDLENVMQNIDSLEWNLDAYISFDKPISMSSLVLIIDDDEEDDRDDNDEPIYPINKGYQGFLSVADLQSVKSNLLEQKPNFNQHELLTAVNYYYENDAFLLVTS